MRNILIFLSALLAIASCTNNQSRHSGTLYEPKLKIEQSFDIPLYQDVDAGELENVIIELTKANVDSISLDEFSERSFTKRLKALRNYRIEQTDSIYVILIYPLELMNTDFYGRIKSRNMHVGFSPYSHRNDTVYAEEGPFPHDYLCNWEDSTVVSREYAEQGCSTEPPMIVLLRFLIEDSKIKRADSFKVEWIYEPISDTTATSPQ